MKIDIGLIEEDFFGLIVPCASGTTWAHQMGGTAVGNPEVEGVFVPLPMRLPETADDPLLDHYCPNNDGRTPYPYELVHKFLESEEWLDKCFEPLQHWVDLPREVRQVAGEAWVPVRVRADLNAEFVDGSIILEPLKGKVVILVYTNSD